MDLTQLEIIRLIIALWPAAKQWVIRRSWDQLSSTTHNLVYYYSNVLEGHEGRLSKSFPMVPIQLRGSLIRIKSLVQLYKYKNF